MNTSSTYVIDNIKNNFEKRLLNSENPKYYVLYKIILDNIKNETFFEGLKLPSTRNLATDLKISRATVIKAYDMLLLEKLIRVKNASGYQINKYTKAIKQETITHDNYNYPEISELGKAFLKSWPVIKNYEENTIAFKPGLPPLDIFPVSKWKSLLNSYWRQIKSSELTYSTTTGIDILRKSISNYLKISRNISCDPEQLIIVSGSLQSLYLIGNIMVNKGDDVIVENPTFPNVQAVFKGTSSNLIPVELDQYGIDIKKLNNLNLKNPKLIHTTPSNHYPSGVHMTTERRLEIIEWAKRNNALIIENDYEHELANSHNYTESIYNLDKENRTIYLGTFNRILHPSIRLGFMVAPKYIVDPLIALQRHSHSFVRPTTQIVMNDFIEKSIIYKHIDNLIKAASERKKLFSENFKVNDSRIKVDYEKFENLHLTIHLPSEVDDIKLSQYLLANGISTHPLSRCYVGEKKENGLIVGYSAPRTNSLIISCRKMTTLINDYISNIK